MSHQLRAATIIAVSTLILAACSSTGTHVQSPPPSSPRSSASMPPESSSAAPTSTSPTVSPQEKAATSAYVAFSAASHDAERKPTDGARANALKAFAVDPALANEGSSLISYATGDIAWGGTPPTPRVTVSAAQPTAKPYPTVTLKDCPTAAPSWKPYNIKNHQPVTVTFPGSKAPPPHAVTATVIYSHSRWLVQKTVIEVKETCAPS